mmetsp:Transcript_43376/g.104032  ORF Transcript_43376/g.104032 Transcript_43376/m.104032 type:complete len:237 (-) Transcript_43376:3-713(-)
MFCTYHAMKFSMVALSCIPVCSCASDSTEALISLVSKTRHISVRNSARSKPPASFLLASLKAMETFLVSVKLKRCFLAKLTACASLLPPPGELVSLFVFSTAPAGDLSKAPSSAALSFTSMCASTVANRCVPLLRLMRAGFSCEVTVGRCASSATSMVARMRRLLRATGEIIADDPARMKVFRPWCESPACEKAATALFRRTMLPGLPGVLGFMALAGGLGAEGRASELEGSGGAA